LKAKNPLSAVLAAMAFCSCAAPVEVRRAETSDPTAAMRQRAATRGLVRIADIDPTILTDLRYASSDNVTGRPLYPPELPCLASIQTARKLKKAQDYLRPHGYCLLVWDAYRPPEAHLKLWQAHSHGNYVSDPTTGWSKHCYGRAVDVTLVDPKGRRVPMPSGFDDFSPGAYFVYKGRDGRIAERLRLLQAAMKHAGFTFLDTEWWHFNDAGAGTKMTGEPIWGRSLGLRVP
jgi:D-alanyl-D-alanine dipeptidase